MNRRKFFESLFKLGGTTVAAPIIAKTIDPTIFEKIGKWLKSVMAPPLRKIGDFSKFMLPTGCRVFPSLIASEFVSIQPMSAPSEAVFYLDFHYQGDPAKEVRNSSTIIRSEPLPSEDENLMAWIDWKD